MTVISLVDKAGAYRVFRTLIVALGWLGAGLMVVDWLCASMPFETTQPALLDGFNQARSGLFLLWPLAVAVQTGEKLPPGWGRWVLAVATVSVSIWLMLNTGFSLAFENIAEWKNQRVLYRQTSNPQVRIAVQRLDMGAMGGGGSRVVKLTPVLNTWQLVAPIDTLRFDARGWQRP